MKLVSKLKKYTYCINDDIFIAEYINIYKKPFNIKINKIINNLKHTTRIFFFNSSISTSSFSSSSFVQGFLIWTSSSGRIIWGSIENTFVVKYTWNYK